MRAWGFATVLGGDRLVSWSADPAPLLEHEREACEAPLPGVTGPRTLLATYAGTTESGLEIARIPAEAYSHGYSPGTAGWAGARGRAAGYSRRDASSNARRDRRGLPGVPADRAGCPVRGRQHPEIGALAAQPLCPSSGGVAPAALPATLSRRRARDAMSHRGDRGRPAPASAPQRP